MGDEVRKVCYWLNNEMFDKGASFVNSLWSCHFRCFESIYLPDHSWSIRRMTMVGSKLLGFDSSAGSLLSLRWFLMAAINPC